jgi:hypothetical protein
VPSFIRALPEQAIRNVGFVETPRNEVMVRPTESFGGQTREWDTCANAVAFCVSEFA